MKFSHKQIVSFFIFIFSILFLTLMLLNIFSPLYSKNFDAFLKIRGKRTLQNSNIVIVAVDDPSIKMLGKWQWNRTVFAKAIQKIASEQPLVLGLDFTFSEAGTAREDAEFKKALKSAPSIPVVCGLNLFMNKSKQQIGKKHVYVIEKTVFKPVFEKLHSGFINIQNDEDGFIRQTYLIKAFEGQLYPSFAFKILGLINQKLFNQFTKQHAHKQHPFLINFTGPADTFKKVSFYQVVKNLLPAYYFKNKIVLIGPTFLSGQDFHFTPFSFSGDINAKMPGVEIHANILENLLNNSFYKKESMALKLIVFIILSALLFLLFILNLNLIKRVIFFIVLAIIYTLFAYLLFISKNISIHYFETIIGLILLFATSLTLKQTLKNKDIKNELHNLKSQDIVTIETFCTKYDISRREKEVLLLIIKKYTNPQMSQKLFVSINTIKKHIKNIYRKTEVNNRGDLLGLLG